jgi:molybdopterin converting factor small subunit
MTVRFFSERRRKGRGARGRFSMAGLRCAELERLFAARYGHELPDDDAGRADVVIMLHHLARCAGDPRQRSTAWCAAHAPWLAAAAELEAMLDDVIEKPRRWRADILAERLGLTAAERRRLRITSIGAIDQSKAERLADRKQRKRLASGSAMLARDTAQLDEALARPQRENVGRRVAALCGKLLQRSIELGNYMSLRFEIRWVVNLNNRSHQAIGPLFSETARVFASSLLEQVAVAIG